MAYGLQDGIRSFATAAEVGMVYSISLSSLREKIIAFAKMTVKTTLLTAAWASP